MPVSTSGGPWDDTMADRRDELDAKIIGQGPDSSKASDDAYSSRASSLKEPSDEPGPNGLAITPFWRKKKFRLDTEAIATKRSVFDNPEQAPYFRPNKDYENYHRFDPDLRWTWGEELPLIRKLDWKVTLWACIAFFALDLPRGNISQANTDDFLSGKPPGTAHV